MAFPRNPPDVPVLASAVIGRVTEAERVQVTQMAALAEMSVSQFVRMGILRYCSALQQSAADRTAVDAVIES